jgi:hypothetical protein
MRIQVRFLFVIFQGQRGTRGGQRDTRGGQRESRRGQLGYSEAVILMNNWLKLILRCYRLFIFCAFSL